MSRSLSSEPEFKEGNDPKRWERLYQRLEDARVSIEKSFVPDGDTRKKILRDRALSLAQGRLLDQTAKEYLKVVLFKLGDECYAFESKQIREVYPVKEWVSLPGQPTFVMGVANIRGQIVSVVDLRKIFGLPERPLKNFPQVIVIQNDSMIFGIFADGVIGVRSVLSEDLHGALPTLTGRKAAYLRGVLGDRTVVLDAEKILSDEQIIVYEECES